MKEVVKELKILGTKERAEAAKWFFKTGKGEYGYGDLFFGVTVPEQRKIAKKYKDISLEEVKKLLYHKVHECRLTGLLILVHKYKDGKEKDEIVSFYLDNLKQVNNWDLVDSTAPYILGDYLLGKDKKVLYRLASSKNLWERRVSIVTTLGFVNNNELEDALKLSKILLKDKHDLIHKAVGWVLREVGKKDVKKLEEFLKTNYDEIPRTTLRYAIERFEETKRKKYLKKKF